MSTTVVVRGDSLTDQITLTVKTCPVCGIRHAAPAAFFDIKDRDAGKWFCPNGHSLVFTKPKPKRLLEELEREKRRAASLVSQLDQAQADAEHQRARVRGYQGALAKTKKRVAKGACPCCHRRFPDLATHMADEHPRYGDDEAR